MINYLNIQYKKTFFLVFILSKCVFFIYTISEHVLIDGIVVEVNKMPIYLSDINDICTAMKYNNIKVDKVKILNELIEQTLVISSSKKNYLEKEENILKDSVSTQAYDILNKYFNGKEKDFIKEIGCSVNDYIKNGIEIQKKQIIYERTLEDMLKKDYLTQEKIEQMYYYLKKNNLLPVIEEYYDLYEIQVKQKDSELSFKKAENIKERLNKENFDDVLKAISEDKDISISTDTEWHKIGDLNNDFEYEIFKKLKKGDISDIIKIDDMYYIVKLIDLDKNKYKTITICINNNIYSSHPDEAFKDLKKIKDDILSKKITWKEAVEKYSQKEEKTYSGKIFSKDKKHELQLNDIDFNIKNAIKNLKDNSISDPFVSNYNDELIYRIVYMKKHVKSHKANIKDDYFLIENITKKYYKKLKTKEIIKKLYTNANIILNTKYEISTEWLKEHNKEELKQSKL